MQLCDAALNWCMVERGAAIVLLGFMGSGKSSIGRALARRTGLPCFDTDDIVAARFALGITEIFAKFGEVKFREAEDEVLRELSPDRPAIVVTGGGIVVRPANVELVRRLGFVVNLLADEGTLFDRVMRRADRPLLQTENPRQTMIEILRVRAPLYRQAADLEIDTAQLAREEAIDAILSASETFRAAAT